VRCALLVPDEDVADLGVEQRVVGGQDGAARDAEDDFYADGLERRDQGLCPGHDLFAVGEHGVGHLSLLG